MSIAYVVVTIIAVITHLRARNYALQFPIIYLLLAASSLALYLAR